jgi:hypothetical protein
MPMDRAPGTHWIRGYAGRSVGLEAMEKRRITKISKTSKNFRFVMTDSRNSGYSTDISHICATMELTT